MCKSIRARSKIFIVGVNVILGISFFSYSIFQIENHLYRFPITTLEKNGLNTQAKDFIAKQISALKKENETLQKKIDLLVPAGNFLVINSTLNKFSVYHQKEIVYTGLCSTGSMTQLESSAQTWSFQTPKGIFTVRGKIVDPVWRKPDWAFIEDGLPVPPPNDPSRFEHGVLGDYALNLGNGYLIHGTLFQRFIGLPVTHGCIRLNDEDLKYVYNNLDVGSKVYIY